MNHSDPKGLMRCQYCGSLFSWDFPEGCPGDPKVTHPTYLAALRDRKLFHQETEAVLNEMWSIPGPPFCPAPSFYVEPPLCPKCGGSHVGDCFVHTFGPGVLTDHKGNVIGEVLSGAVTFIPPPDKK